MFQFLANFGDLHQTPFCTQENFATSVTYLSKELTTIGYPPLVPVGHDKLDVTVLVNITYDLLKQVRDFKRSKAETENYSHKLATDLQHLQTVLCRQKESCQKKEREAAEALERERQTAVRLKKLESSLKKVREENHQLVQECDQHQAQFQHTLRRKDLECSRLSDQLLRLIQSKSSRGSSNCSSVPLEIEMNTSLLPQGSGFHGNATVCNSTRRKWDKTESSNKLVEDKWRLEISLLEKDLEILRNECVEIRKLTSTTLKKLLERVWNNNRLTGQSKVYGKIDDLLKLPLENLPSLMDEIVSFLEAQLGNLLPKTSSQNELENLATLETPAAKTEDSHRQKDQLIEKLSSGANEEVVRLLSQWIESNETCIRELLLVQEENGAIQKAWKEYNTCLLHLETERSVLEKEKQVALRNYVLNSNLSSGSGPAKYFSFTPSRMANMASSLPSSKMAASQKISQSPSLSSVSRKHVTQTTKSGDYPTTTAESSASSSAAALAATSKQQKVAATATSSRANLASTENATSLANKPQAVSSAKSSADGVSKISNSAEQAEKKPICKLVRENTVIYATASEHTNQVSIPDGKEGFTMSSIDQLTVSDSDYEDSLDEIDSLQSNRPAPTSVQMLQLAHLGEIVDTPVPSRRGSYSGVSVSSSTFDDEVTTEEEIERWSQLSKSAVSNPHTSVSLTSNASVSAKVSIIQQGIDTQDNVSSHEIPTGVSCSYRVTALQ